MAKRKIDFQCPRCKTKVSAPQQLIGDTISCPECERDLKVPAASTVRTPADERSSGDDSDEEIGFAADSDSSSKTPLNWAGSGDSDDADELTPIKLDGISDLARNKQSFSVKCKVCDSRVYVAPVDIGKEVECPDCYSKILVPKPKKKKTEKVKEHSKAVVPENQLTNKAEKDAFADLGMDEATEVDPSFGFAPVVEDLLAPAPQPESEDEIELEPYEEEGGEEEGEIEGDEEKGKAEVDETVKDFSFSDIQIDDPFAGGDGELTLESLDEVPDLKSSKTAAVLSTDALSELAELDGDESGVDDLSLAPELDLPPEVLHKTSEWGGDEAPIQSPEFDDDEEIELIDESPEVANRKAAFAPKPKISSGSKKTAGGKKRKKKVKKSADRAVNEEDDDELDVDPPERAHAAKKKRGKKKKPVDRDPTKLSGDEEFPAFEDYQWWEPAKAMIQSGGLKMWGVIAAVLLAIGNGGAQQVAVNYEKIEAPAMGDTFLSTVIWIGVGVLPFLAGCLLLWLICSVIFREAAMGQRHVDGFKISAFSELQPTFLAFAFPFFIGGLPMLLFNLTFLSVPVRFLLGSVFLLAAWYNRAPFQIISTDIFSTASKIGDHWKNYLLAVFLLSIGGMLGGALMTAFLTFTIVIWIGSVIGAVIVTIVTMLYAAVTGWHCGYVTSTLDHQT